MKFQPLILSCIMMSLLLFGCSYSKESMPEQAPTTEMKPSSKNERETVNVERKLIKKGTLNFETNDINATRTLIFKSIEKHQGYASSDNENKSSSRISNTIVIRVPAKNFDRLVSDATKGITRFDRKNIEVKDVTEEFLDVEARLKTKRELELRYLELLGKAMNVTEILEIQKQAGDLRAEIESIEGRLKYLENNVSFSTLTMSFYQPISTETEFANKFKNGAKKGWENLIWTFVFMTHIWPFLLIFLGMIFGLRTWLRRRNKRRSSNAPK